MITWSQVRVIAGVALILVATSAVLTFDLWQRALAGLSPDGVIMDLSWVLLRIMLMALIAPGIVLVAPGVVAGRIVRGQVWMRRLPVSAFLTYTLAGAAVLRIIVVLLLPLRLTGDFASYDQLATLWVTHGEYTDGTHPTAYFPPGWPFFLSRLYMLFGHSPHIGIIANIGFGVGIVYLTWRLVRRIWGEYPARWAALIVAVIPSEVLFTNILGSEGLFTVLLLVALVFLLPRSEGGFNPVAQALAGGMLLGLATLTRTLSLLIPLVLLAVYVVYYGGSLRAVTRWVACVAGLLIVIVPWMMRNEARLGRATICTNIGVNLFIGNNPNAGVGYHEPDHSVLFLKSAADEVHDDSVGFAKGMQYMREHPLAVLVRGTLKSVFFLTCDTDALSFDVGEAAAAKVFNRYCWLALVMQAFWMVFLMAVGLGVLGFLRSSPSHDAGGILLLGVILYWIAIHFVFYGAGRYHMPIVPMLAAFAGLAIARVADRAEDASPE